MRTDTRNQSLAVELVQPAVEQLALVARHSKDAPLPQHPAISFFPEMSPVEFSELRNDIGEHGLREPITVHENAVLDGRHRYRACLELGIEPAFKAFSGDDPINFVVSQNLHRRHLSASQRAVIAARLGEFLRGRPKTGTHAGLSQAQAARAVGVSERAVREAVALIRTAPKEVLTGVVEGLVSLKEGQRLIRAQAAKLRSEDEVRRHAARVAQLNALSPGASPIPMKSYRVLLADPPWQFEARGHGDNDPSKHYPVLALDGLKALPVAQAAADDALLFLWSPAAKLAEACYLMSVWGFTYRTAATWVKPRIGTGKWLRHRAEFLLIGVRGSIPIPPPARRPASVIEAPAGKHSEKPEEAYQLINSIAGDLTPRLELFARKAAEGWQAWGYEAPQPSA